MSGKQDPSGLRHEPNFFLMIAVVEIGGKQYTVSPNMTLVVDRQATDIGSTFDVTPLLLANEDGKNVQIGTPLVSGGKVVCRVLEHFRGDKIRVFKMKSKKHYSRTRGFRPSQTRITIESIA